ncbi:MAG TPA: hypothetical protein VF175_13040 [Lacipirellula sp.]
MKLKRKTLGFILGVLATLAVVLGLSLAFGRDYPSRQTARRSFTLDHNFTDVRKILVRNDAAKQIVTMGGGSEYIDQEWSAVGAELDAVQLLADWRLELHGTLHVRTKDEYIGEHVIGLLQDVEITPDFLHSATHLNEPAERLKEYDMKTHFDRDPETGNTKVSLELTQVILTDAPWFAHGIADRRVKDSAERTLANQEAAIRKLVADNIDDVPLFPLR